MTTPESNKELVKQVLNDYFDWQDGESFRTAVEKLEQLIAQQTRQARIDELQQLIGSGAAGDKYRLKTKHGFITVEERLQELNREDAK